MWDRFRELLRHLRFESDHPTSLSHHLPIARKLLLLAPHAVMFLLFNFGSAFRRRPFTIPDCAPEGPKRVESLRVSAEVDHGLPFHDQLVNAATFDAYDSVVDPVFAMSEIHRVLYPGGFLTIPVTDRFLDPRQRRLATAESIATFVFGNEGIPALFEIQNASASSITLRSIAHATTQRFRVPESPQRIDLGCGGAKRAGYVGIDSRPLPGVDIVRDIERHGLPFSDGTITAVYASHFLEHVRDLVAVMNEMHRVCCPGALVECIVPTLLGPWAVADPTHVRLFNARSFEYFTSARLGHEAMYGGVAARFEIIEQHVSTSLHVCLRTVK